MASPKFIMQEKATTDMPTRPIESLGQKIDGSTSDDMSNVHTLYDSKGIWDFEFFQTDWTSRVATPGVRLEDYHNTSARGAITNYCNINRSNCKLPF